MIFDNVKINIMDTEINRFLKKFAAKLLNFMN